MAEAITAIEDGSDSARAWRGGVSPFGLSWGKLMMWIFLLSDAFTFGGFLTAYAAARHGVANWPPQLEIFGIGLVTTMTFILICSSATMAVAVHAAKAGEHRRVERFLVYTILGGIVFLGFQAYEWTHFIQEGARLHTNPWGVPAFSASFFIITGFHGSHVTSGVIYLGYVLLKVRRERAAIDVWRSPLRDRNGRRIDIGARIRLLSKPQGPESSVETVNVRNDQIVALVPGKATNNAETFPASAVEVIEEAPEPPMPVDHFTRSERVENVGLYWHFVDLVWVFVFTLMYLL
jgi:cytochrome c oxidase subunit 3